MSIPKRVSMVSASFLIASALSVQYVSEAAALEIVAPGDMVAGRTIGEWTAEWWRWAFGQSVPNDAFTDTTGRNADVAQDGPVFFVAGTAAEAAALPPPVSRKFSVPGDKYLLIPLLNVAFSEQETGITDPDELRQFTRDIADEIDSLTAAIRIDDEFVPVTEIAGSPITDLFLDLRFSLTEPEDEFSFEIAPDNPFGVEPGDSGPAFADGYYLMIAPLGDEVLKVRYGGGASAFDFTTEVVATIPEPATFALFGLGLTGLVLVVRELKKTA